MEQALFYILKSFLLEIPNISLIIWIYIIAKKNFAICLSRLKSFIIHLSFDFFTVERLLKLYFGKKPAISKKQKNTISECSKFTSWSYRILKIQQSISFAKIWLATQVAHHVKLTSIWRRYYVNTSKNKFRRISTSFPCAFLM